VEVPGAGIVAESFPGLEDRVEACTGKRVHVGEALQETLVVGDDRGDPGLLEHDLGHPDAVGIARFAPGQVPLVCPVPVEQKSRDVLFGVA